jgi:hypothetical protein
MSWYATSEEDYPTGQVSTSPLGNGDVALTFGDMAKSNATLIAAAPCMLDALRDTEHFLASMVRVYERMGYALDNVHAPLQKIRAAIAKATGSDA